MYDPTEGQILLDGIDLREYDLEDLRRRIGGIFQDFVRYHTTARENIGFGQIENLDNTAHSMMAAERGGADEVIEALPDKYETVLGAWLEKGHELSGGQWQKIARLLCAMARCWCWTSRRRHLMPSVSTRSSSASVS